MAHGCASPRHCGHPHDSPRPVPGGPTLTDDDTPTSRAVHRTSSGDVAAAKADARRRGLAARAGLTGPERVAAERLVAEQLERYRRRRRFTTLCAYAASGTELSIDGWLRAVMAAGVGVFLPAVDGDVLRLLRVRDLDTELRHGYRGIREPTAHGRRPARVDRIDTFVVPGAAFDAAGGRLGYGGGHFDRLLRQAAPAARRIGVAFEAQVQQRVPAEPHDVRMDAVVTEARPLLLS